MGEKISNPYVDPSNAIGVYEQLSNLVPRPIDQNAKKLTFSEYYKLRFPEYDHEAPHVKLLISTLEGMVHNDALIINMPSGFGKYR